MSPSPESRIPDTGSDPPIGSGRESGRDKLSIRARIVGLRLQDMDSMVGTALTIEREIEDARSTRDASVSSKRKDSQSSSSSGKRQRASSSQGFQSHGHPGQGQMRVAGQAG